MHYTIGFTIIACLNLAVLIPLKHHPLVDNYAIVMCVPSYLLPGIDTDKV